MTTNPKKLIWAISGAGDWLPETVEIMTEIAKGENLEITAVVSKMAVKVAKWYKLWENYERIAHKLLVEKDANTPFIVGPAQTGQYECILVAPASANTVAKIVHGIADTIITNLVAQTNKTDIEIFILPVDQKRGTRTTILPDGKRLELKMRDIDIENSEKLRKMEKITVLEKPMDIKTIFDKYFR